MDLGDTKTKEQTDTAKRKPFKSMRSIHHGHNLHLFRERAGLSQTDLAKKIKKTQQYISQLEQSEVIEPDVINILAQALDIDPQYISDWTTDNSTNVFNVENGQGSNFGINNYEEVYNNTVYPIDKVCELYERMLNEKDAKIKEIEDAIKELKAEISNIKE